MSSSSLMKIREILRQRIEQGLLDTFEKHDFSSSLALKDMLAYHMGWHGKSENALQGKRIRPQITLLFAGAYECPIENALPAALAIEFLHNFTLIHDDIQDKSSRRHGRLTLWKKWGVAQAINAGDALFSIAQLAMLDLVKTTNAVIANEGVRHLNQVCLRLTQGQHSDIAFESNPKVDIPSYIQMIAGKTGALIALSANMGGMVAQQQQERLTFLSEFGENLGLAFQIQDDFLGIWGDSKTIGKSTASDILRHKKTLPILFGLMNCPEFQEDWQNETPSSDQIYQMAETLTECGAKDYTMSQVEIYTKRACNALEYAFSNRNVYTDALFDLANNLLNRKI